MLAGGCLRGGGGCEGLPSARERDVPAVGVLVREPFPALVGLALQASGQGSNSVAFAVVSHR